MPSADTMERARALRSAVVWASNEAVEIIAQALTAAQEEAGREQRERDAQIVETGVPIKDTRGKLVAHVKINTAIADAIRNQESST